jgi:hypothetical protein
MDKITTTIERQWLREIVARRKKTEYRKIKRYWTAKLEKVGRPFLLRLINGMRRRAPEVTVRIDRVRKNKTSGYYELRIGRVVEVKNWNRRGDTHAI